MNSAKVNGLDSFSRRLLEAAEAGDRDRYTSLFRPDASIFMPHRPPVIGRSAIGAWFETFSGKFELRADSYEQEQVDIVGDVAMVRSRAVGHYVIKESGETVALDQKYLDVLVYGPAGWQMAYHVADSATLAPGIWDRDWEQE